jgi:predicted nuclease of restriction endonuclease-like (RecB) superfamily
MTGNNLTRSFFEDVRRILAESRHHAYSAINFIMVEAYWKIGRRIVEEEQAGNHRAEYGTALIRELSRQLSDEFGKGFAVSNIKDFRQFYLTFSDFQIHHTLRGELGEEKNGELDAKKSRTVCGELDAEKSYTVCSLFEKEKHHALCSELGEEKNDELDAEKSHTVRGELDTEKSYALRSLFEGEKHHALRRELSWSHYRHIMRVQNPLARIYYVNEAADQHWSVRQLERNIKTFYYERLLSSQSNSEKSRTSADLVKSANSDNSARFNLNDFIKDPYVLEFLDLPESWSGLEETLESAIIERLQNFLLELGKGFSFVGRQFRISSETSHFYIDLVFYNYLLKCFVLIDLKTEKLTHQDIGQMDMYVRMFDDLKRGEDDNPTIGIIFCTDKDETIVHYSVMKDNQQLFTSKYRLILPSEEELQNELERRNILRIVVESTNNNH